MTFEVHYWKAEPFFRKHEKFIRESWERYYSLEFDMLNTSQEQFKLLKEAKQCFSQKKNIDREAKSIHFANHRGKSGSLEGLLRLPGWPNCLHK